MPCPVTGEPHCKCEKKYGLQTGGDAPTVKETARKLFTDHAMYIKFYIESFGNNLKDVDVITARLLKNQDEIGEFVRPIVGEENGNKLAKLLREHIMASIGALKAMKSGDVKQVNDAEKVVFANSKEVATLLSSFNPKILPLEAMIREFSHHNEYILQIATLCKEGKYEEEVKTFDAYFNHMITFSDMIAAALTPKEQDGGSLVAGSSLYYLGLVNDLLKKKRKYKALYFNTKRV